MKFRKTGAAIMAAAALSLSLGLTGCSSSDGDSTGTKTSVEQSQVPPPTAAELNTALKNALGGTGDDAESTAWIEGAEDDPNLIPSLVKSQKDSGATIKLSKVDATGVVDGSPTASASGEWTVNGQTNPLTVPLVYIDKHWKVSKEWTCNMLQASNQSSKICPAA